MVWKRISVFDTGKGREKGEKNACRSSKKKIWREKKERYDNKKCGFLCDYNKYLMNSI
jgi:hypothetical protein